MTIITRKSLRNHQMFVIVEIDELPLILV